MPIPLPKKKNPLTEIALDSRAWGARNIMPGETAYGFFYFQTEWRPGAYLYINGIREARTQKDLFYAEVPMDLPTDAKR